jgi:cystathionine gamma-synthase
MNNAPPRWSKQSLLAQAMGRVDAATSAIIPPIHLSTTFERAADNAYPNGLSYGRADNATVHEAEQLIAMLEEAEAAMLFSSGMAAISAVFLSLKPGDHIVASRVMYTGARHFLARHARHWGLDVDFVDTSDVKAVKAVIRPHHTKLIYTETPANPLWIISDIAALAEIAHQNGALLCIDSTVATPILSQPLKFGADIVVHAATKYLNGHSDVLAGAIAFAHKSEIFERIQEIRILHGAISNGFDAYLLMRGMRTLDLRVKAQSISALHLAQRLEQHPALEYVLYPGLTSHKGHDIAAKQMQGGFGGMLSIAVKGGAKAAIDAAARVTLWKRATSLGGVESLIEHRASVEGEGTPCPPQILRLSVGLENVDDLYEDLNEAFKGL